MLQGAICTHHGKTSPGGWWLYAPKAKETKVIVYCPMAIS